MASLIQRQLSECWSDVWPVFPGRSNEGVLPGPISSKVHILDSVSEHLRFLENEERAKKILKDKMPDSLKLLQETLIMERKPRLRKVEYFLCDLCDKPIMSPKNGFIIKGNIYAADAKRGGFVGDNFPEPDEDGKILLEVVKENVLCKNCLRTALELDDGVVYGGAKRY